MIQFNEPAVLYQEMYILALKCMHLFYYSCWVDQLSGAIYLYTSNTSGIWYCFLLRIAWLCLELWRTALDYVSLYGILPFILYMS